MPGISPPCDHPSCKHPYAVHGKDGEAARPCRVTGCECPFYLVAPDEPDDPEPEPKRLVIEIPEGFAVTVQLVPIEGATP